MENEKENSLGAIGVLFIAFPLIVGLIFIKMYYNSSQEWERFHNAQCPVVMVAESSDENNPIVVLMDGRKNTFSVSGNLAKSLSYSYNKGGVIRKCD